MSKNVKDVHLDTKIHRILPASLRNSITVITLISMMVNVFSMSKDVYLDTNIYRFSTSSLRKSITVITLNIHEGQCILLRHSKDQVPFIICRLNTLVWMITLWIYCVTDRDSKLCNAILIDRTQDE